VLLMPSTVSTPERRQNANQVRALTPWYAADCEAE
jgi:hypothetical protein